MEKLFVGNLPFSSTKDQLQMLFAKFGEVHNVTIVQDENGASRGFGFVEMDNAEAAIKELDELDYKDRALRVRAAIARGGWGE